MKRSYLVASTVALSLFSLAGCGGPRMQPAQMAPPVSQPAQMAPPMNGGMNSGMNGGMNGGMAGGMPAGNTPQSSGVYNWQDVPVNQQVGIQRAQFDQGGYQLITDNGDTIVVPFVNQNLYVMRFGRTNGQSYFVNEGGAPTLYLAQGFGLANANAQGALWYPIPANYNYTRPMYVGMAPSWNDYTNMGWYPGMMMYGGMYGYNPYHYSWMPGFNINIGGNPYYGWGGYHTYYMGHPGYYRPSVVYTNYNTATRGAGSYRYTGSYRSTGSTGSYSGTRRSPGSGMGTGSFNNGSRPTGSFNNGSFNNGSRPTGSFNTGSRPLGSSPGGGFNSGARPSGSFNGGASTPSAPPTRGSFGGGSTGGYSPPPPRSSGSFGGGGSSSRPSSGSFGGGSTRSSGSFGGGRRR